jgi:hypothetical protein
MFVYNRKCVCNNARLRLEVQVMYLYNRECTCNSARLKLEVSVMCACVTDTSLLRLFCIMITRIPVFTNGYGNHLHYTYFSSSLSSLVIAWDTSPKWAKTEVGPRQNVSSKITAITSPFTDAQQLPISKSGRMKFLKLILTVCQEIYGLPLDIRHSIAMFVLL